jgi:hypothetical protein
MTEGSRSSTAGGLLALLLPSFTRGDPGMGRGLDVRDELGNRVPTACVRGHVGVASTCRSIPGVAGDAAAGMGGPSSSSPLATSASTRGGCISAKPFWAAFPKLQAGKRIQSMYPSITILRGRTGIRAVRDSRADDLDGASHGSGQTHRRPVRRLHGLLQEDASARLWFHISRLRAHDLASFGHGDDVVETRGLQREEHASILVAGADRRF